VVVDVAVVAHDDLTVAQIGRAVRDAAGPLLDELWWFDEFRGAQLPADHRSLAYRLRLQDPERQLSDQDADGVLKGVEAAVVALGASLRH
jgi:phenylalanyl-tRNA synthetase beta chain